MPENLQPSIHDQIALAREVAKNYNNLIQDTKRIRGKDLVIPKEIELDFRKFKVLMRRYSAGDFRHYDRELAALKTVAQWTLDVNCALRNQPSKTFETNW